MALPIGHVSTSCGGRYASTEQGAQQVDVLVAQHAVPQVDVARRPLAGSSDEGEAIARNTSNRRDRRARGYTMEKAAAKHVEMCCRLRALYRYMYRRALLK